MLEDLLFVLLIIEIKIRIAKCLVVILSTIRER